jgi:hypothetical protein
VIKKNCLVCNKEFETYPCHIKAGKGKYCSKKCSMSETNKKLTLSGRQTRFKKGASPHNKKGFSFQKSRLNGKVYKLIYKPEHPFATKKGYVREHRLVIEENIGRILLESEVVHHIDGNSLNNSLENLQLMTFTEHCRLHTKDNVHKRWIKTPPCSQPQWQK